MSAVHDTPQRSAIGLLADAKCAIITHRTTSQARRVEATEGASALEPLRLGIKSVRCFATLQNPRLGRITVLVGENSTGKSTFLAICSLLPNLLRPQFINFNRPPFLLGAYRNIATMIRNGKAHCPQFEISVSGNIPSLFKKRPNMFFDTPSLIKGNHDSERYRVITEFVEQGGQPRASLSKIILGDYVTTIDWSHHGRIVSISNGNDCVTFDESSLIDLPDSSFRPIPWSAGWPNRIDETINRLFRDRVPRAFQPEQIRRLGKLYLAISEFLKDQTSYAIAPIRSVPRRTYDPVQSLPEPEGSHVPMILSRVFAENQEDWNKIREQFDAFGRRSGLHEGISIRPLGDSPSDPFQIELKVGGRTINLHDVGYGVSQVLPVIVDSITQTEVCRFLLQQPEIHLHPRGHAALAAFLVDRILETDQEFVVETHSDQFIDQLRIEIRQRELDPRTISLLYLEKNDDHDVQIHEIDIDNIGNLENVPSSYREFFLHHQFAVLGLDLE